MAIYLVDYENVYIDGLSGIDQLTESDVLHIFYTQNRCGLTFGLYEQLIRCKAKVKLNEVSTGPKSMEPVKNALDMQLMMYAGYLIGTQPEQKLYIVSKDKDFQLGADFLAHYLGDTQAELQQIPCVAASMQQPEEEDAYEAFVRTLQEQVEAHTAAESFADLCEKYAVDPSPVSVLTANSFSIPAAEELALQQPDMLYSVQYHNTVRNLLGKSTDEETVTNMCEIISSSDNLLAFNNALARYYRDGQRAKVVYHKIKPRFENLRHLSRACRKG